MPSTRVRTTSTTAPSPALRQAQPASRCSTRPDCTRSEASRASSGGSTISPIRIASTSSRIARGIITTSSTAQTPSTTTAAPIAQRNRGLSAVSWKTRYSASIRGGKRRSTPWRVVGASGSPPGWVRGAVVTIGWAVGDQPAPGGRDFSATINGSGRRDLNLAYGDAPAAPCAFVSYTPALDPPRGARRHTGPGHPYPGIAGRGLALHGFLLILCHAGYPRLLFGT